MLWPNSNSILLLYFPFSSSDRDRWQVQCGPHNFWHFCSDYIIAW